MLRPGLFIAALIASLGPAAADDGCEKFAWSLARERAAFAASDKTTTAAGETLNAVPAGALLIRLQPGAQASFEMPPERKPRTEQWHGGMVRLPAPPKPGIYQITLSDDAWIDVTAVTPARSAAPAAAIALACARACGSISMPVRSCCSSAASRRIRSPSHSVRCNSAGVARLGRCGGPTDASGPRSCS